MKTIHSQPVLDVDRYLQLEDSLDIRQAQSYVIRVRVDWNGGSDLGTFEVLNSEGNWEPCGNLSPEGSTKDLILGGPKLIKEPFAVHIERGPTNVTCPFDAWARSITWKSAALPQGPLSTSFSAVRDQHYEYASKEERQMSILGADGIQVIKLMLDVGWDWELWISLRHPTLENVRCDQDPIIRPGDRGGLA